MCKSKFFAVIVALLSLAFAGIASAEVFAVNGGSVAAVQEGDNVVITATGIPAVQLVHFRGHGVKGGSIHVANMKNGVGVLEGVSQNGARFQLKDASGKWLLVAPTKNGFKMVGVVQECRSKSGCALEAKL